MWEGSKMTLKANVDKRKEENKEVSKVIPKNCIRCKKPRGQGYFVIVFCQECIRDPDINSFLKLEGGEDGKSTR